MKQSPQSKHEASQTTHPMAKRSAAMLLLATALDTTWRVFVPTIGGMVVGIGLDLMFHTVPVFAIILIILGMIMSGLLVAQQLRAVRRDR